MKPQDTDLAAIASHVSGMNKFQIQAVRDRIVKEVAVMNRSIDARMGDNAPLDDPGKFALQRDRFAAMRRRREVDYLENLLRSPDIKYGASNGQ
jgi:hypothetical protein